MKSIKKQAREILTSSFLVNTGQPSSIAHSKTSKVMQRVRARIDKQFNNNNNSSSRLSETVLKVYNKEPRTSMERRL